MDVVALIVAISGLLVGGIAGLINWNNSKRTIKKDEFTTIREEVVRLQTRVCKLEDENEVWREKYNQIYDYVIVLRGILVTNNIPVPQMPRFKENEDKKAIE